MNTRSKKIQDILFGRIGKMEGGTPVRATISSPTMDGKNKEYFWDGNKGIILHLLDRIETLENEIKKIKDSEGQ